MLFFVLVQSFDLRFNPGVTNLQDMVWVNSSTALLCISDIRNGSIVAIDVSGTFATELELWPNRSSMFHDNHPQGIATRGGIVYTGASTEFSVVLFSVSSFEYLDGFNVPEIGYQSNLRQLAFNPSGTYLAIGRSIENEDGLMTSGPVIYEFTSLNDTIPRYYNTINRTDWSTNWGGQGCTFISEYDLLISNGHEIIRYTDFRDTSSYLIFVSLPDNKAQRLSFSYNVIAVASLDFVRVINMTGVVIFEKKELFKAQSAEISPDLKLWYISNRELVREDISYLPLCDSGGQINVNVEQECINGTWTIIGDYKLPPSLIIDTGTITVQGDLIWTDGSTVVANGAITFNVKGCVEIKDAKMIISESANLPRNSTLINYNDTNCVVDSVPTVEIDGCRTATIKKETSALFLIVDDAECNTDESSGTSTTKYFIGAFVGLIILITIIVLVVLLILRPNWLFPFRIRNSIRSGELVTEAI